MRNDRHSETLRTFGDFEADAAQAENAQRFPTQFHALQGFLFPLAGVHGVVGRGQFPSESEHQAEG